MSDSEKALDLDKQIAEVELKRQRLREMRSAEVKAQELKEQLVLLELEEEHGVGRLGVVKVPFEPNLPLRAICRVPTQAEMKRYRARLKITKDGEIANAHEAAEELGQACRVYPSPAELEAMAQARPSLLASLGSLAVTLAGAQREAEGKD